MDILARNVDDSKMSAQYSEKGENDESDDEFSLFSAETNQDSKWDLTKPSRSANDNVI